MSHYLLYLPICLVIFLVLETCRHDDPKAIVRKSLFNFGVLTLILLAGSAILFAIQSWT